MFKETVGVTIFQRSIKISQLSRSELVSLFEECYQNESYDDAINHMKEVIKMSTPLSCDQRQKLFWCYIYLKQPFYALEDSSENSTLSEKARSEKLAEAEYEITKINDQAIELMESYWVKRDVSFEAAADYKCFLAANCAEKAGYQSGQERKAGTEKAFRLFDEADKMAKKNLSPAHPVVLNIAYYVTNYYRFLLDQPQIALSVAREAYEKGLSRLNQLPGELKRHAEESLKYIKKQIMKILKNYN